MKQITALKQETSFLWIAFAKDTDDLCTILKTFGTDPDQSFFTVTREVDKVTKLDADGTKLYAAYDDETYIGESFSLTNPAITFTPFTIPAGIFEAPVDMFVNGGFIYFLTPGVLSGQNAKIIKFNTSAVYQETIDLTKTGLTIYDANSFVMDDIGDIYIVTYTDPATVVRVFFDTAWDFAQTVIL